MKELQELLDKVKISINEIEKGKEFIVKDVFSKLDLDCIKKDMQDRLDCAFLTIAKYEYNHELEILDKTAKKQQAYRKL